MPTNILIVEDEFLIALEMQEVVHELGHVSAGVADNREAALEMASENIDVALVDVNLADGASGPVIGAQLASQFGIQVVFVTANPDQLGDGVEGTLGAVVKPVDLAALAEVLDFVLARKKGELSLQPPARLRLFDLA